MRVLFIQQDHGSPLGPIGERFEHRGYDVETFLVVPPERFTTPDVHVSFPDPLAYDAIVPLGAPWSVYDDATIGTWIHDELKLLRTAHESRVPLLGICFGGQAMAAALGGSVEPIGQAELGWHAISTDEPDLLEPGPWFQFHADRWTTPPNAVEIARGPLGPQAFRLDRSLALQFHPEVTAHTLEVWNETGGAEYMRERGVDPDAVMAQTRAEEPAAITRAWTLVDRFLDVVATS